MQAALNYTDSQQQDVLHLRRLFYGKRGQLARERAAILEQLPAACKPAQSQPFHLDIRNTAAKLAEATQFADQLSANRLQETQAFMSCGLCLYRCVSLQFAASCAPTLLVALNTTSAAV